MKKFISVSSLILAILITLFGAISVSSVIVALAKGVEFTSAFIKGAVSCALVLAVGSVLLFTRKQYDSVKFWIILGVTALILMLDRFVFFGLMGFGSAFFNIVIQGSAVYMETVFSVVLIIGMILALLIIFLSVMEKETGKSVQKSKDKRR